MLKAKEGEVVKKKTLQTEVKRVNPLAIILIITFFIVLLCGLCAFFASLLF